MGTYETQVLYEACNRRETIPVIPPRKGATLRKGLAFTHRKMLQQGWRVLAIRPFFVETTRRTDKDLYAEYPLHTANTAAYSTFKPILNLTRATKKPPDIIRWLFKSGWWVLRDSNS